MTDGAAARPATLNGALALTTLGIVFGDIGTSPLYAMREILAGANPVDPSVPHVYGVTSMVVWALLLVITAKYLLLVLRADNQGEGGIIALLALLMPQRGRWLEGRRRLGFLLLVLFGATLLFGDGIITPAISVLSAVEGIAVALPAAEPAILPVTVAIIIGLFLVQRSGTRRIGRLFGPVMLLWFLAIGALGIGGIVLHPQILLSVDPRYAIAFVLEEGWYAFLLAGAVFLVVTGGEALYADMGHVGRRPIRLAWFGLVLPALLLNYFGQAALILSNPAAVTNPFYLLAPDWLLYPLVALATCATVIASQAVISGVFSLTRQAVQLNLFPRLRIVQTSAAEIGQVYVPAVNGAMLVGTVVTVLLFGSSGALAAAYGVAVTTTMLITTLLLFMAMRRLWSWPLAAALPVILLFLAVDLVFLGANYAKIPAGGWYPLAIGGALFAISVIFVIGNGAMQARIATRYRPLDAFLDAIETLQPQRIPGIAVCLTQRTDAAPPALQRLVRTMRSLHETVILLHVERADVPRIDASQRYVLEQLPQGFLRLDLRYGFMQEPDIPIALKAGDRPGLPLWDRRMVYLASRWTPAPADRRGGHLPLLLRLYRPIEAMQLGLADYLRIPAGQVFEIGMRLPIDSQLLPTAVQDEDDTDA